MAPDPSHGVLPVAASAKALRIGGFSPLTTLDFPGELAAVAFCQGCPWRCRYCHNGHLLSHRDEARIHWSEIEILLEQRRGLLDAVVFSGGEPTLQGALQAAMESIRTMGFKVGLHTAGCYPRRLRRLLPLLDWVGLDIKALPGGYPAVTGVVGSGEDAWESLRILSEGNTNLEVRTTLMPGWTLSGQIEPLMRQLAAEGVTNHVIQTCRTMTPTLDPTLAAVTDPPPHEALQALGNHLFPRFATR